MGKERVWERGREGGREVGGEKREIEDGMSRVLPTLVGSGPPHPPLSILILYCH